MLAAVDEKWLKLRLGRIKVWNPRDVDTIEQYRSLFRSIGTHLITSADYGGRLNLNVWADNSNSEVNQAFDAAVGAEFNGLTTQGKVDMKVDSADTAPNVMSFHHESLWNLINGVVDPELAARGPDVQKAYNLAGGEPGAASRPGEDGHHE
ncbi:MAG: hypothetical protein Q9177_002821 [Variospora cf. flavescens]